MPTTIVIPVYNREHLIESCVCSALNQTQTADILIVDNCSTDNTWERLTQISKNNPNVKIIKNNANIGPVLNWYEAISSCKTEYCKILFSDDLLMPNCVEVMEKYLHDQNVGFVSSSVLIGTKPETSHIKYSCKGGKNSDLIISSQDYLKRTLIEPSPLVSPCAALFRKSDLISSLEASVKRNTEWTFSYLGAGPDLNLFLDTALKYKCVVHINEPLAFFLDHAGSATKKSLNFSTIRIRESYSATKISFANRHKITTNIEYLRYRLIIRDSLSYLKHMQLPILDLSFYEIHPRENYFLRLRHLIHALTSEIISTSKLFFHIR